MLSSLAALPQRCTLAHGQVEDRREPRRSPKREQTLRVLVYPSLTPIEAGICNISARGIGLLLRPVEVGAVVTLLIRETASGEPRTLSARVVHSTRRQAGDWLIGCMFSCPLNGEELEHLFE